jgi:hypothetical protein
MKPSFQTVFSDRSNVLLAVGEAGAGDDTSPAGLRTLGRFSNSPSIHDALLSCEGRTFTQRYVGSLGMIAELAEIFDKH